MPRRFCVLCAILSAPLLACGADALLDGWNRGIATLEKRVAADPDDFIAWNLLIDRYLRRERWTGDFEDLRRADRAATQSLKAMPADQNSAGLAASARIAFTQHRFAEARTTAEKLRELMPGKSLPWQMLGDAQLELGDLDDAAKSYAEMTRLDDGSASTETRLARLATMRGRLDEAREHLETARDLVEQQGMANPDLVIWTRVQLGELAFKRGDWDGADAHFHAALEIAPEHWSVLEHVAELEAARGHDAGAVAFYERAIAKAARPELWQALGDYHAFAKRPDDAKRCHEKALAGYRASIDRGELLYVHHLAGFYADSQEDAAEAVKWARRDMEQRHGALAWDALAWALYRQGDIPASLAATKKALATGIADPHVLYHAAMIHLSAGEIAAGQSLLKRCAEVNPHFNAFHAHR